MIENNTVAEVIRVLNDINVKHGDIKTGIQYQDEGGSYYGFSTDGVNVIRDNDGSLLMVEGDGNVALSALIEKLKEFDENEHIFVDYFDEGGSYNVSGEVFNISVEISDGEKYAVIE